MPVVPYTTKCSTCNRTINEKRVTVPAKKGDDFLICERCFNRMPVVISKNISKNIFHNNGYEYNKDMIEAYKNSNPSYQYNKGHILLISVNGKRQFKKFAGKKSPVKFLRENKNIYLIGAFDNV